MISRVVLATHREVLGIAIDNNGFIYYSLNSEPGFNRFDPKSNTIEKKNDFMNDTIRGIIFDGMDTLYLSTSQNMVRLFSVSQQAMVSSVAERFTHPTGLAVDEYGDIYIADVTSVYQVDKKTEMVKEV